MDSLSLAFMRDELEREKFANVVSALGKGLGVGAGRGAIAGGGLGASFGVLDESRKSPEERNLLRGLVRGGLTGGAVGATVGGVGRTARDVRLLAGRNLSGKETAKRVLQEYGDNVKRFGQRQVHGLTGHNFGGADIGMPGKALYKRRMKLERARLADDLRDASSLQEKRKVLASFNKTRESMKLDRSEGEKLRQRGLTHLPGVIKGLATKPVDTMKSLAYSGKKFAPGAVALPVAFTAPELLKGDESATGGKTVSRKLLDTASAAGSGILFRGLPTIPGMAAWSASDAVVDRLAGGRK